ncbi:MAG: class II fructose-bisphosphate aldolase [Bacteroidota bacterium]
MALTPIKELFARAEEAGAAVGAFNLHSPEAARGIVAAAAQCGCPVILQVNEGTIKYFGLRLASAIALAVAAEAEIPVAVHLDHGSSVDLALACLEHGFNSVMFDGSRLPLQENISKTRQVVAGARRFGAAVEAELGRVGGAEEDLIVSEAEAGLTNPDEAREFAAATGVDSLAVAIGTAHGVYKGEPRLDFDRLTAIKRLVMAPLVMHGASGLSDAQLRRAVIAGARKVNFSTELKQAFIGQLRRTLTDQPEEFDPRRLFPPAQEAVAAVVRAKLAVLWPTA